MLRRFLSAICSPAPVTTADRYLAGYIVESFPRDFDEWTLIGNFSDYFLAKLGHTLDEQIELHPNGGKYRWVTYKSASLRNTKKELLIEAKITKAAKYLDNSSPWLYYKGPVTINDIPLDDTVAKELVRQFDKVAVKMAAIKKAADKAIAEMERNEAQWDLYERLTGFKRNYNGALVPAKPLLTCEDCGKEGYGPAPCIDCNPPVPVKAKSKSKKAALTDDDTFKQTSLQAYADTFCIEEGEWLCAF